MIPKEKAVKLVNIYLDEVINDTDINFALELPKRLALIAVDEIVKSNSLKYLFTEKQIYSMEETSDDRWIYDTFMEYWEEVKQEIEKL